jgi:G3E family GTPase
MNQPLFLIPITILGGFLGSGKTTLLNRILSENHSIRFAVLVNDYGEINIDTKLLPAANVDEMIDLPNGCICCTLARGLLDVVENLVQADHPPEHIIIEASGISSPHQIKSILDSDKLKTSIVIQRIVTLVDAVNAQKLAPMVTFIEDQVRSADLLLLNKIDLVVDDALEGVIHWLRQIAPETPLVKTQYSQLPIDIIFRESDTDTENLMPPAVEDDLEHGNIFRSWSIDINEPLSKSLFESRIPEIIAKAYRAKGVLHFGEYPQERYVFQAVNGEYQLKSEVEWDDADAKSTLVVIGFESMIGDLDIEEFLCSCTYK